MTTPDTSLAGLRAELAPAIAALLGQARTDLAELVAIPSVFDPAAPESPDCTRAARWVLDAVTEAGLGDGRLVPTPDGSTAVIARTPPPAGAPTVLLYCHYDVQPPLDPQAWRSPPFTLTEQGGRWYGRGAADCKGNLVAHLTALRALRGRLPVGVVFVAEGSEETGTGGLERLVEAQPDLFRADAIVVADAGNAALGVPTLTTSLRGMVNLWVTVEALAVEQHSGSYGGAAPDALAALIQMLATLRDARGNTTVEGLDSSGRWDGVQLPEAQFRTDAGVLDGVELLGDGTVADMIWARPALTVVGIDVPPVVGSANAIQPRVRARLNLRIPAGTTSAAAAQALTAHLHRVAPWGVRVHTSVEATGEPFLARTDGPACATLSDALRDAYGTVEVATQGQGGSIPLCTVLQQTYPDAELMLIGVEEPQCLIHAPNESVHPAEIERTALAEAVFLASYRR